MTDGNTAAVTVGDEDGELRGRLVRELTAFNAGPTGDAPQGQLSVRVTGAGGELAGGLAGWTWGGLLGIELLWVHEDVRRDGWGSKLLAAAEAEAVRRGCDRAVVSSFTFQAPGFYERHGYRETGRMLGVPGGHEDVWFFKRLTADGAS